MQPARFFCLVSTDRPRGERLRRLVLGVVVWLSAPVALCEPADVAAVGDFQTYGYAGPTDVAVSADGRWLVVVNARGTVALVDRIATNVVDEIELGGRPVSVVRRRGSSFLVATSENGSLFAIDVDDGRLVRREPVRLGYEPSCIAVGPDANTAYISLAATGEVAVVTLDPTRVASRIEVGRRPGGIAASLDGNLVAVACVSPSELVLIDPAAGRVRSRHRFQGFNPGRVAFGPDGREVYVVFTYDGGSHPTPGNIRRGWVTGSRLGRLRVEDGTFEGLSLDVAGQAVGDVFGLAIGGDGRLVVTAGGTHEVLCLSGTGLPWTQISGSEVMDRALAADTRRFTRLHVGGRPLGVCLAEDGRTAFVADALADAVHEIRLDRPSSRTTHPLPARTPPTVRQRLVRRGEAIFYDADRSLDHWYSCHTCHYEGGGNTVTFDTLNDGATGTYKTVLPLWGVTRTGPWTWHGWQGDLEAALEKSLLESMQGPRPTANDLEALAAFLDSLQPPPSPFVEPDGSLRAAAKRGRELFLSARAGCGVCHAGVDFTTPEIYDVGLGHADDRYRGFSPPTLRGLHRKTMYLHHGRCKSLRDLLAGPHSPDAVSGLEPFSQAEIDDLVAYLTSL